MVILRNITMKPLVLLFATYCLSHLGSVESSAVECRVLNNIRVGVEMQRLVNTPSSERSPFMYSGESMVSSSKRSL